MRTSLNMVTEFHQTFDHPIAEKPAIPAPDRVDFRVNFLKEELNELLAAAASGDLIEYADALADLQYVLNGAILEAGLGNTFENIMQEVHRSNMSKACKTESEAQETVDYLTNEGKNGEVQYMQKGDHWIVYRVSDNKVMKSVYYSPANIKMFLNN